MVKSYLTTTHMTEYYLNRKGRYYFRTKDKLIKVAFSSPQLDWAKVNGLKYGDRFKMVFQTANNGLKY